MKTFHIEITKIIVESVNAESYDEACKLLMEKDMTFDLSDSFHRADPQFKLLQEGD